MSRTFRRKTKKLSVDSWVFWNFDARIGFMQYEKFSPSSVEGKKAIAKYHSDAGIGDYWFKSRSGWIRRLDRKRHSRKCEQALHKFFNGLDEDCVLPTYKHCWLD
jgi:hypothetical protein